LGTSKIAIKITKFQWAIESRRMALGTLHTSYNGAQPYNGSGRPLYRPVGLGTKV